MTDVRVTGVFREVLNADAKATLKLSSVVREILVSSQTVLQVSGIVREVLRTPEAPPVPPVPPGARPWERHLTIESELEETWYPTFRQKASPVFSPVISWKRPSFLFIETSVEEFWYPLFQYKTLPAFVSAYLRMNFPIEEEAKIGWFPFSWSRGLAPVVVRKKMRPYLQLNT